MTSAHDLPAAVTRFEGFADLYDATRPTPPPELARLLCGACGQARPVVVDLGSGTGLSTRWIAPWAAQVIGIEPSADMRRRALAQAVPANVTYRDGLAQATGLAGGVADLVIAVQAAHWLPARQTLDEVARLLRPGGLYAAFGASWPPLVGDRRVEALWEPAMDRVGERKAAGHRSQLEAHVWPASEQQRDLAADERFEGFREIGMVAEEPGDADRFVDLLVSQGHVQDALKQGLSLDELGITALRAEVRQLLGPGPVPFWFPYTILLANRSAQG